MTRRFGSVLACGAVAAVAGCGSSGPSDSAFKSAWAGESAAITALGTQARLDLETAKGKTDADLAQTFTELAGNVRKEVARLQAMKAPDKYKSDLGKLETGLKTVAGDLDRLSSVTAAHDAKGAAELTTALAADSPPVKAAHNSISSMAGTPLSQ